MAAGGDRRAPRMPATAAERATSIIDRAARTVTSPPPIRRSAKPRPVTKADLKRELLELARSHGWRGKTYHGALKFVRALERKQRRVGA